MTMQSNSAALDLYHKFVAIIDNAEADRNIYAVPEAAEAEGMNGGEVYRGMSQRWDYSYQDGTGQEVLVHARWWDQSKSFSIQPDKHVMSVELKSGGITMQSHTKSYEE